MEEEKVKGKVQKRDRSKLLYGFNDKPKSIPEWIFLSIQQAVVIYVGMIVVPIMFGGVLEMDALGIGKLVCGCAIGAGVASIVQIWFGSKLPILVGPSFGFALVGMSIFFMIDGSSADKLALYGSSLVFGGIITAIIGYSGLMGLIKKLLTPAVTGTVITLIGIGLATWAADEAGTNWLIAIIMMAIVFFLTFYCSPKVGAFSALIAVVVGWIISMIATKTGLAAEGSSLYMDFTSVKAASWFTLPKPFPWGAPRFSLAAFLVILAPFFAAIVEAVGDYLAVAKGAQMPAPTKKQINRGIGAEGIGCIIAGIFGGSGVTTYTQNTSLMILTKVASKFVYTGAAAIVIVLGFMPKIGTFIGSLPSCVMGGVYFSTFGLILAIGIQILGQGVNMNKDRNLTVAGLAILSGIAVPYYIGLNPIVIENASWVADILNSFLGTGMIFGAIVAIVLDRILPDRDPVAPEPEIGEEPELITEEKAEEE